MRRRTNLLLAAALFSLAPAIASASFECDESHEVRVMKYKEECPPAEDDERSGFVKAGWPEGATWALGGAAALGVAGAGFALRSLWLPPARAFVAPFFARLTRRDVTDHPIRARILALVGQRPGISATELAVIERLNSGTLDYHLNILERDGQVRTTKAGRTRLLFLPGSGVDMRGVAEVSTPGREDIARAIQAEPGLHASALSDRLGLSRATVHHHLARLEASGLVRIERGVRARCYPTDRLGPALEPVRRRRLAVLADPNRPPPEPSA